MPAAHSESIRGLPDRDRDVIAEYYEQIIALRERTWASRGSGATTPESRAEIARNPARVVRTV